MAWASKVGVLFFCNNAEILHLNWGQDGLMSSSVSDLVENTDNRSFICVRKSSDGGDQDVTDLMVVDASDVNLPAIC